MWGFQNSDLRGGGGSGRRSAQAQCFVMAKIPQPGTFGTSGKYGASRIPT